MSEQIKMPMQEWPSADKALWERLIQKGNPFDDQGALSHLRPYTLKLMHTGYGIWLRWIAEFTPEAISLSPEQRATPEQMKAWVESMATLAPSSRHMYFNNAFRTLKAAYPKTDWTKQKRLAAYLERDAKDYISIRKNGRIVSSEVLFKTGLELASTGADAARTQIARMKHRRDGCLIAFLAAIPSRTRAMVDLQFGKSLLIGASSITVCLEDDINKTGVHWETEVPAPLMSILEEYLNEVRPWLMTRRGQEHDYVWVNDKGAPLTREYFAAKIRRVSQRELDVCLSPHLFRDAAATTLARESPADARLIRSLLGHSSHETAERYYNHAKALDATRTYADIVNRVKKGA